MRVQIALFNHLLKQHPAVRADLAAHAGRRIALQVPPVRVAGVITDEGWLAACEGAPEAGVRVATGAALTALTGRQPDLADVVLEGDATLATTLARLLGRLRWDATEDLSRVVGDMAAARIAGFVRRSAGLQGEMAWRLAENWLEHLREEAPLLARNHEVAGFVHQVDTLRDDVERLEKRLRLLEAEALTQRSDRTDQG